MNIILLGPPGVGKGTHAVKLMEKYNIPQISTGDILRQARAAGTEIGKKAQAFMDAGKLVPDEVIVGVIEDRIKQPDCKNGAIFDGFPRTVEQAKAMDALFTRMKLKLDAVVNLQAGDALLIKRLTGRRGCPKCNANYNVYFGPPKKEGVCDKCASALTQRKDDNEQTIKDRLQVYRDQTAPLIEYYSKRKGLIKTLQTDKNDVETLTRELISLLGG